MNDHQESDHFAYNRNDWWVKYHEAQESGNKKKLVIAARNIKALEGVVKTLRWVLGDMHITNPLN